MSLEQNNAEGSDGVAHVSVGLLRQSELGATGRIFRDAFGAFLGVENPFGDADYVWSRWHATPEPRSGPASTASWWPPTSPRAGTAWGSSVGSSAP
jgi:hypothetical protein